MLNYYEIGQRIRKFRKAQGLSQEELAERVNISTTHMSHIETANTKLSLAVLVDIAEVLEVSVDDLLRDHPETQRDVAAKDIVTVLDRCNAKQSRVIADIVKAAKISLDKNL